MIRVTLVNKSRSTAGPATLDLGAYHVVRIGRHGVGTGGPDGKIRHVAASTQIGGIFDGCYYSGAVETADDHAVYYHPDAGGS